MAGFMDYFTGGAGGTGFDMFGAEASGMNDLLTAQQQEAIKRQSMLAMAAQLLQAGGRSTQRTSLGQALGQGVMAGQQAQEKGTTGAVNQMLLRSKLDEAKRAQALQGKISDIFATAPMTQQDAALAAPESVAGAPGPTVRRLELSATINPKLAQAETYRRAAAASATDPAKAKTYMDIADQLDPRQEVTGQPFKLTDASGEDIMVQQMKSGEIRTMPGYGVPREVVLQNLGGQTVAIDKSQLTGGQTFQQTMTPAELANLKIAQGNLGVAQSGLKLRQDEYNRGAFEIKETPTGFAYVPKAPGGAAMPVMGAGGQQLEGAGAKPTEDQSKSAGFLYRMKQSSNIFNQPVTDKAGNPMMDPKTGKPVTLEEAFGQPGRYQSIMRSIPSAGLTTGIAAMSEDPNRQMYRQAQENWVTANLRPESGAVIGADEMEKEIQKYFPQTSDAPETIKQKSRARRDTELAMQVRAGPVFRQIEKLTAAPAGAARLVQDPTTGVYRYVTE
jgi:hypothetical protein